jgi:nitrate reductase gamma subunit
LAHNKEAAVQSVMYVILVPMVYIAFAVFLLGIVFRVISIWRKPKLPSTQQIHPSKNPKWLWALYDTFLFPMVLRHKPVLWLFLMAFHVCLFLLLIGHLELLADFDIFQVVPHEIFLGNGFVGLIAAVCLLYFLFRRFVSPVKDLSIPEDYYLLVLIFLIVIFGSEMDWARRWYDYGEMTVEDYRTYLVSLLIFKPELPYSTTFSGHSFMLVLHVFFANLFLIIFPFSQLMHSILSLPVNKLRRG